LRIKITFPLFEKRTSLVGGSSFLPMCTTARRHDPECSASMAAFTPATTNDAEVVKKVNALITILFDFQRKKS
jgi:hypothetical protein